LTAAHAPGTPIAKLLQGVDRQERIDASAGDAPPEAVDLGDEAQILEVVALVGYYHTISFLCRALDLPLEAYAARFPAPPLLG
jgi:hypothetical protein